jgi:hypothetical protein
MAETFQFSLPLLAPAQAQKHVTVNEAIARLDALSRLRLVSTSLDAPPPSAMDGASYLVAAPGSNAWAGKAGQIAIRANGGWVFVLPKQGWTAWSETEAVELVFDGQAWHAGALAHSNAGAATLAGIATVDHVLSAGTSSTTAPVIPAQSSVIGVTGRVIAALSGAGLTGWRLGVSGSNNRYGQGLGLSLNSYAAGLTGATQAYYSATPLLITSEGGPFAAGTIRLSVHYLSLVPPRMV